MPGSSHGRNAPRRRSRSWSSSRADRAARARAPSRASGRGAALPAPRSLRGRAEVYDDYAHHPTEIAATLARGAHARPARLIAVFQPHLYSRTAALAREFGEALAGADVVVVLDVYAAREWAGGLSRASAGCSSPRRRRRPRPTHWMPDRAQALAVLAGLASAGTLVVVMGAGDVDALGRALVADPLSSGAGVIWSPATRDALPPMTPTGAPPSTSRVPAAPGARRVIAWGGRAGRARSAVVGSGSNLLVADAGVRRLVIKLERELARIDPTGRAATAAGARGCPRSPHAAAALGLAGSSSRSTSPARSVVRCE